MRPIEADLQPQLNPEATASSTVSPEASALAPAAPSSAVSADGRSARSQRTRESVVDALLALLRQGNLRPTAKEIADEAGTSLRSVYVHFDDLEDLFCAASERQNFTIGRFLVPVPSDGPFEDRLASFVAQRGDIWEATAPVRAAAALQEPFSPGLAAILEGARTVSTVDLERVFQSEFEQFDAHSREAIRATVDALSAGSTWDHWRKFLGRSHDEARHTLAIALRQLLTKRSS